VDAGLAVDESAYEPWPTLPSLDELQGTDGGVVALNGEQVMIDVTSGAPKRLKAHSSLSSEAEQDYDWGLRHAAEMDHSAGRLPATDDMSVKIQADAEEVSDAQALMPKSAMALSESVSVHHSPEPQNKYFDQSEDQVRYAKVSRQQEQALQSIEKINRDKFADTATQHFPSNIQTQWDLPSDFENEDGDDRSLGDIAEEQESTLDKENAEVKQKEAELEEHFDQQPTADDAEDDAEQLVTSDNLDTESLVNGDKEAKEVLDNLEAEISGIGTKQSRSANLKPKAQRDGAKIPALTKDEKTSEDVLKRLETKVNDIDLTVENMDAKARADIRSRLLQKHTRMNTKLKKTLNENQGASQSRIQTQSAKDSKLTAENEALTMRVDVAHTKESAAKVKLAKLKAKTGMLKKQNERAAKANKSTKTEEQLLGKVQSLESALASVQRSNAMNAHHDDHHQSVEKRLNFLERKIQRLSKQRQQPVADKTGTTALKSLSQTLNDAMKMATGSDQMHNLALPDEFRQLELAKKKQHLIKVKSELEDELYDLQRKHKLMKVRVQAEQRAAKQQSQLDMEAKEDQMNHQIAMQNDKLRASAEKKVMRVEAAITKEQQSASGKEQTLENEEDHEKLEYDKAKLELQVLRKTDGERVKMLQHAKKQAIDEKLRDDQQSLSKESKLSQLESQIASDQEAVDSEKIGASAAASKEESAAAEAASAKEKQKDRESALKLAKAEEREMLETKDRDDEAVAQLKAKLQRLNEEEKTKAHDDAEAAQLTKALDETKAKIVGDYSALAAQKASNSVRQNALREKINEARDEKQRASDRLADADLQVQDTIADVKQQEADIVAKATTDAHTKISTMKAKLSSAKERFRIEYKVAKEDAMAAKTLADEAERAEADRRQLEEQKFEDSGERSVAKANDKATSEHSKLVQQVVNAKLRAHKIVKQASQVLRDSKVSTAKRISLAQAQASKAVNDAKHECVVTKSEVEAHWQKSIDEAGRRKMQVQQALASAKERTIRAQQTMNAAAEKEAERRIRNINSAALHDEKAAAHMNSTQKEEEDKAKAAKSGLVEAEKHAEAELQNATALSNTLKTMAAKYNEVERSSRSATTVYQEKLDEVNAAIAAKQNEYQYQLSAMQQAQESLDTRKTAQSTTLTDKKTAEKAMHASMSRHVKTSQKLKGVKESNQQLRDKIAQLKVKLATVEKEKAINAAKTAKTEHNITVSKVDIQQSKLDITRAQQVYAARKDKYKLAEANQIAAEARVKAIDAEARLQGTKP
jgi:hypothetical protein